VKKPAATTTTSTDAPVTIGSVGDLTRGQASGIEFDLCFPSRDPDDDGQPPREPGQAPGVLGSISGLTKGSDLGPAFDVFFQIGWHEPPEGE
jgi:hypothetical protein